MMSSRDAFARAQEVGLDLVEVAPHADPPVCKMMDYGKFRYQQQKRAHEAKKKQTVIETKEIKFRPKTETGDKAKVSVTFRGREIVHRDLGRKILDRFIEETKEIGEVEMMPKMEGRSLTMILIAKTQKSDKKPKG